MGLFDRVSRIVRANLNSLVSSAEDPEKILNQTISDMQEDLIQMRQAVATAIASQNRMKRQYEQAQGNADEWQRRAELALRNDNEGLAREALVRRKTFAETANGFRQQLDQQGAQVQALKSNLTKLESKISEARTKKDMLIARARSAKASQQINEVLGRVDTTSSFAAFERMQDKVDSLEAKSAAVAELATDSLDTQFAALEAGGLDVDDELANMKAQMALGTGSSTPKALEAGGEKELSGSEIDAELEKMRSDLNQP